MLAHMVVKFFLQCKARVKVKLVGKNLEKFINSINIMRVFFALFFSQLADIDRHDQG